VGSPISAITSFCLSKKPSGASSGMGVSFSVDTSVSRCGQVCLIVAAKLENMKSKFSNSHLILGWGGGGGRMYGYLPRDPSHQQGITTNAIPFSFAILFLASSLDW